MKLGNITATVTDDVIYVGDDQHPMTEDERSRMSARILPLVRALVKDAPQLAAESSWTPFELAILIMAMTILGPVALGAMARFVVDGYNHHVPDLAMFGVAMVCAAVAIHHVRVWIAAIRRKAP